jgi:hypothetical protein
LLSKSSNTQQDRDDAMRCGRRPQRKKGFRFP